MLLLAYYESSKHAEAAVLGRVEPAGSEGIPLAVRQTMGFALWQAQLGGKHIGAKALRGFGGAGVLEVVEDHDGNTYRTVYTVRLPGAVYVLHVFQKKSKRGIKTPPAEIETIRKRLKAAEEHHAQGQHGAEDPEGRSP